METPIIYLDYNATTPIDQEVINAMLPFITEHFGNPSSNHRLGNYTANAIAAARRQVAESLSAEDDDIIFTGGGSEANNLAIKGVAYANRDKGKHIIISSIEHPAISAPSAFLKQQGYQVTEIPVDEYGMVSPKAVESAIRKDTVLISIMLANNEIGTIQPIQEIAGIARKHHVLTHTDAAQAVGKMDVSMKELGVDLMSIAGHKFYAPKGVGALIKRKNVSIEPIIHGAGHEGGLRAGTENVPYIVALAKAAELAHSRKDDYQRHVKMGRDRLYAIINEGYPGNLLNGHPEQRLCNTLNLSFPGIDSAKLIASLADKVACSAGSACHSGKSEPSKILLRIGRNEAIATSALRLSLGLTTTTEEVNTAGRHIVEELRKQAVYSS